LEKTIELKRQQAEALGYPQCPYDALLDEYEPEALTADLRPVLEGLREELVPLVAKIQASRRRPNTALLHRNFPVEVQDRFGREAAAKIGFDFTRGRLDVTTHPFCTTLGPHDCRITTRYDDTFFNSAFFGILHEAGHGLYEQGLLTEDYGLPSGEAISLGIHESQSRLWENLVGRSRAFWTFYYPLAQQQFPAALGDVALDDFYFAINDVRPSLVRVEADEATYNLHILIRFELERALLDGELEAAELPGAWNEKYQQYLGITPPNDREGVLQDVHWSAGLIGYFPTYSLGNLYAAQFFAQARKELGNLDETFGRGDFRPLLDWLRQNIHRHGQRWTASELVERVTGRPLSAKPLVEYLQAKLGPLYGF
jgi:carboxypeptidase Taq